MSQLPQQPWNEGDKFTNDATGVEYTFDGVKWLASGGEDLDLSGFEDASVLRDEVLNNKIDQESNLNTAAHLKMEDQIQWIGKWYQEGDQKLQDQIDDCVKQSASWDMSLGTTLGVNQLKPLDDGTPFVYYEPRDWDNKHPCGIVNRGLMQNYVDDAIDGIEFPEADLSDYVSKSGDEITGQLTIKKSTQVALDIVGDGNQSQIKFWSSGAVALQNYTNFKDNELVTKKYVDDAVSATPVPESNKSRISTQVRTMFSSQAIQGKSSFIDRSGNRQFRPDDAVGIEYTISRDASGYVGDKDWWRDDYEPLDSGYIQVLDPFTGAVRWAAGIGQMTRTGDTIRWMASGSIYTNFPNWNSNLDYFLILNGCLREK